MPSTVFEKADVIPLVAEIFREFGYEGTSLFRVNWQKMLSSASRAR